MNGIASIGIGYNGKEISIIGYSRYNFNANIVRFLDSKYVVNFELKPHIPLDKIDKRFYVNELYLFANGKKIGVQKITRNTLYASSGLVQLPISFYFNIYKEER